MGRLWVIVRWQSAVYEREVTSRNLFSKKVGSGGINLGTRWATILHVVHASTITPRRGIKQVGYLPNIPLVLGNMSDQHPICAIFSSDLDETTKSSSLVILLKLSPCPLPTAKIDNRQYEARTDYWLTYTYPTLRTTFIIPTGQLCAVTVKKLQLQRGCPEFSVSPGICGIQLKLSQRSSISWNTHRSKAQSNTLIVLIS